MPTTVFLVVLLASLTILSACSHQEMMSELAVAKMPKSELQAMNFLPLNGDRPGTPVDVENYLVPGKYTIVAYLSPYDAKSVSLEPRLIQLCQVRNDIAVRTVNINRPEIQGIDWGSPIAQSMQIQTLPYFLIFEPSQRLRAKGRAAYEGVMQFLRDLR